MLVVLYLCRMRIIFGVDDQRLFSMRQHNIGLHHRQHGAHIIIQLPRNLGGIGCNLRIFLTVVFQNELLIQPMHSLFIQKIHELRGTVRLCLQKALHYQEAD